MDIDPLRELEPWAKRTERRARRAHRVSRLRAARRRMFRPRRLLALAMVMLVAVALWLTRGSWMEWGRSGPEAYPTTSHPAGVYATSSVSAGPAGPFDGTPAASFAKGEAGIAIPAATAVDGWTTKQVAEALGQVRRALIAMYLDRKALVDHDPATLLALLAPTPGEHVGKQYADPTQPGPAVLISSTVKLLLGEEPRVSGRTTVRGTKSDGMATLEVITNYVFVYAFDVPDRGVGSRVAIVHMEVTWRVYAPNRVEPRDRGLWIDASDGYHANIDCEEAAKGLLAPHRQFDRGVQPSVSEDPNGVYDPNRPLDVESTCK